MRSEKPTGLSNKISQASIEGDTEIRVGSRSSILGQIRKPFFNITNRILTVSVPQPKTTHFILRFCLIEKKLDSGLSATATTTGDTVFQVAVVVALEGWLLPKPIRGIAHAMAERARALLGDAAPDDLRRQRGRGAKGVKSAFSY